MLPVLFIQAIAIGLFLAMPIGPIALFCMRNSLHWGMRYGVVTGLGAAAADAFYGLCALFGMMALSFWLNEHAQMLHLLGGIVLCIAGIIMLLPSSVGPTIPLVPFSLPLLFFVSFFLTLANPGTFLLLCALYSNFEICVENVSWIKACTLSLGIFIGSTFWWIFLSTLTTWGFKKIPTHLVIWSHRIMGSLFIGLGLIALLSVLRGSFIPCS